MIQVRPAEPGDIPEVLRLIHALAVYEREPNAVMAKAEDLSASLFPTDREPLVGCLVAQSDDVIVGIALSFVTFSTWEGRHGLHLEDLFVQPDHRGLGVGRSLISALATEAVGRGYRRLEWSVLDWNEPARSFYSSLGAVPMDDWIPYRLSGAALRALAGDGGAAR